MIETNDTEGRRCCENLMHRCQPKIIQYKFTLAVGSNFVLKI